MIMRAFPWFGYERHGIEEQDLNGLRSQQAAELAAVRLGHRGKSQVARAARMLLAPLIEEAAVAEGDVLGGIDAQAGGSAVDPFRGAFELGVVADGRFVDDAVAFAVVPLGAPLFIAKGGDEAKREKDLGERVAVGDLGFRFDAVLVAVFAGAGVGAGACGSASSGRRSCGCAEFRCGRACWRSGVS